MNSLPIDILTVIFQYLGWEETIWNCRRVCKSWNEVAKQERLAEFFVRNDKFWQFDHQKQKKLKKICYYEYAFKRVTGELDFLNCIKHLAFKFFQKCIQTVSDVWQHTPKPIPEEEVLEHWRNHEFHNFYKNFAIPWELHEFQRACCGLSIRNLDALSSVPFNITFWDSNQIENDVLNQQEEENIYRGIHFNKEVETKVWLTIGEEATYGIIQMCCDRENPDFGSVAYVTSNGLSGIPVAHSLVELFAKLYHNHTRMVKKWGVKKMNEFRDLYAPCDTDEPELKGDEFDYFRSIVAWE